MKNEAIVAKVGVCGNQSIFVGGVSYSRALYRGWYLAARGSVEVFEVVSN